ncbi:MAG TPA: nitrilase-related carbon-nitrogen hydrolase [Streptosporangiaceae bacterium]|jgi:predicted amidohydrolase
MLGVRCLLAAITCEKGDVEGNLAYHLVVLADAAAAGCELAVFPEMSLTGSADPAASPQRLITLDHPAVAGLARATGETGTAACFGLAERHPGGEPHITQAFAAGGCIVGVQRKRHLGEGEEAFTPATRSRTFDRAGVRFGVAICAESGYDAAWDAAAAAGARLMLFPAAPGLYGRRRDEAGWQRGFSWWEGSGLADARRQAQRLGLWVAMTGQAGPTVDEDFPGLAALIRPDGSVAARLPDWREGVLTVDIPL